MGHKRRRVRWWERRYRRVKPPFVLAAVFAVLLLALLFPWGFIMLILGAFLALLGLYFFCWWR
jgi:polyferredoxin